MVLKENLRTIKMHKGESSTSYHTRAQEVCDEIVAIREKCIDRELVHVALNGFTKYFHPFLQSITGRDKLSNWENLWSDFIRK